MIRILWALFLGILLHCTPASAQHTLDYVLEQHARAHGTSRHAATDKCTHTRMRIEAFGLVGEMETWSQAPLQVRSHLKLGPLSFETYFDGETAWIKDRNDSYRIAEGAEKAGLLLDAIVQNSAYLLEHPPIAMKRSLVEEDGDASTLEIRIQPMFSDEEILVLDSETFRLKSSKWDSGQGSEESTILEFTSIDGVLFGSSVSMSMGNMVITAELELGEFIDPKEPEFFHPTTTSAPEDLLFTSGENSGPLPMLEDGGHILLKAKINDSLEGSFLLDTGAGSNVLNRRILPLLNLQAEGNLEATGAGGNANASFVDVDKVEIGAMTLLPQSWITLDLSSLEGPLGGDLLGVLGYDMLSRVVSEIDYENRVVIFHNAESYKAKTEMGSLELRMDYNVPSVKCKLENIEAWIHLDTGSDSSLDLAQPFYEKHSLLENRSSTQSQTLRGIGGISKGHRAKLRKIELGTFLFQNVEVNFNEGEEGIFANTRIAGIMGSAILGQFNCIFDYGRRKVWLEKWKY